jgi:hypothetical protein
VSWQGAFWWPHKVLVRDMLPGGGMGPRLSASTREVDAEVKDGHRLVRTVDGREVVSTSTVTVPLVANVPLGSEVTVWPGTVAARTGLVVEIGRDENPPPLPSHLILSLA